MSKPFKSIDEQISILISRKLILDNKELVKKQLLSTTYYNTVNSYGYLLRDPLGSGNFIDKATFKELFSLYTFDKEVKDVFFRFLTIIETVFKSTLAYGFCELYKDDYAFLYSSNYKNETDKIIDSVRLTKQLSKIISQNRKKEPIKHYCDIHKNVPLWVLVKKMDFGTTHFMYSCMKLSDQNHIAKIIGNLAIQNHKKNYSISPEQLINYIHLIKDVRNVVAHNERMLDFKSRNSVMYHTVLHSEYGYTSKSGDRKTIYDVYIICKIFLTDEQFINFTNSLKRKLKTIEKRIHSIPIDNLLSSLGFPKDWHKN